MKEISLVSKEKLNNIEQYLDLGSKSMAIGFKLSVLMGATIILIYCYKISYYPNGISLGDAVLFILAAAVFGGLYLIVVLILWSIGTTLMWPLQWIGWYLGNRKKDEPEVRIPKPNIVSVMVSLVVIYGTYILITSGQIDWVAFLSMVGVSFMMGVLWSFVHTYYSDSIEFQSQLDTGGNLPNSDKIKKIKSKKAYIIIFSIAILLLPLLLLHDRLNLINRTMQLMRVRTVEAVIYVDEPYSGIIQKSVKPDNLESGMGALTRFSNINILFYGIGKEVLIELPDKSDRRLRVPSDKIIIETANNRLHGDGGTHAAQDSLANL